MFDVEKYLILADTITLLSALVLETETDGSMMLLRVLRRVEEECYELVHGCGTGLTGRNVGITIGSTTIDTEPSSGRNSTACGATATGRT